MTFEGVPKQPDKKETIVDWDELRQGTVEKVQAWAAAAGKQLTEEEIQERADGWNNFPQYFKYEKGQQQKSRAWFENVLEDGYPIRPAQEENEKTTLEERFEYFRKNTKTFGKFKRAQGPEDFYGAASEKFLSTPVAQFFRDIDEALELAGLTEEDLKIEPWRWDNNDREEKKEAFEKVKHAFHYLISRGYNWRDLAS